MKAMFGAETIYIQITATDTFWIGFDYDPIILQETKNTRATRTDKTSLQWFRVLKKTAYNAFKIDSSNVIRLRLHKNHYDRKGVQRKQNITWKNWQTIKERFMAN